jgi:3'(2'), 5'-bisphosphate nucleotidase
MKALLNDIVDIAKQAGQAILEVYQGHDFEVRHKADQSPVTKADLAAHYIIVNFLQQKYPLIPCLSEEGGTIPFAERIHWDECFIIDPLDGTKEFIERNGEFTVNIALQKAGKSILGVVHIPVENITYYAAEGLGAFKQVQSESRKGISVRNVQSRNGKDHIKVVATRRHGLEKVKELCQSFASYDLVSRGSSLKMCLIAEGKADFYPRLAPTAEWDTAAAQAIVEQAGGKIVKLDFSELKYNQKEDLLNPHFLVLGDSGFDWGKALSTVKRDLL